MGWLTDPKLLTLHNDVWDAIYNSGTSYPDWQKCCGILNGMSMPDMLDEIWRIKMTSRLDNLALFVPRSTGVNIPRLRAAIGAVQDRPPGDMDALLHLLPDDQQFAITSVRAVTQAPDSLSPSLWSNYYWSTRSLAPPDFNITRTVGAGGGADNDSAHAGLDAAAGITANAPLTRNPMTMQVSVVFRNLDALKLGEGDTELALLHEPNVSVQLSPDPNNPVAYQGAISLVNLHLKRNWGLIKPDVELSLSGQAGFSGGAPNAGLQAQLEVHVSTQISVTASSSVGFGPLSPGPPDRGSIPLGNGMAFTPFMIGIVGHWDPPPAH
jgi:hypothetical protein